MTRRITDIVSEGEVLGVVGGVAASVPIIDDQTAAEVDFTPSGDLVATNVQDALEELDTEKLSAVAVADITATGTPSATTYLRGDGSWSTPAGGSGGLTLIGSQTLASATATVTFSSIPGTYSSLMLVMQARTDRAAANDDEIGLRFNGDSSALYDSQYMQSYAASTVNGGQYLSATNIFLGGAAGAASPSTYAASCEAIIPNYAGTSLAKNVLSDSHSRSGATNAMYRVVVGGTWRSTAAITSLSLISRTGANFVAGSTFTLYGLG